MVWKWLNLRQNLKIDNNDYNEYNNKEKNLKKDFSSFFGFLYAKRSFLTIQDYFRTRNP